MLILKRVFPWLMVLLWMLMIFNLSHKPAAESNKMSIGVTEIIKEVIETIAPRAKVDVKSFNHFIRKNAHFFVYLVLGVLVSNGLRVNGVVGTRNIFLALLICIFYAISDEVHQIFVPGRGAGVKDVMLDSLGAFLGIGLFTHYRG